MKTSKIFAGALLAMAAFAASATAVNGSLTINGYEHAGAPVGTMTIDPAGWLNLNAQNTTAGVGALDVTFDGTSYLAYCIELMAPTANFGQAKNYTMNTAPALAPFGTLFSASQESRLTKLFVKNGGVGSFDATGSAAMQLAIWEIMYDDSNFGDLSAGLFGLGAGEFYSTAAGGARSAAETLIAGLDSYDTTGYSVGFASFNNGGNKVGKQDFLTASVTETFSCNQGDCGPTNVPEPSSLALMFAGLAAAAVATKRRKTA
jgi:hypothetical protein